MNVRQKFKKTKKHNYIIYASMATLLAACQEATNVTPTPTSTLTNVTGDVTTGNDVIKLGDAGGFGIVDALAGDDEITGGSLADFIRGNEGVDHIKAGAGVDNIVVIGQTSDGSYKLSDIQNPNGTGIDLSVFLSLDVVNNHAVSDIQAGEVIDGGADGAVLFVYGDADFTGVTLSNITRIDIHSEVSFTAKQIKSMIDGGTFNALVGDGNTKLIITNDGANIELDFSGVDIQGIDCITVANNVTLLLDQADLQGLNCIKGDGAIKAVTGTVNLDAIQISTNIAVYNSDGDAVVAAPPFVNSMPTGFVDIGSSAKQGVALIADGSSLADFDGLGSLHYQWKSGSDNVGTDSPTYTPVQDDGGKTISVVVTYTDGQGILETVTSNANIVPVDLKLSALNGINGFRLDGQTAGDLTGRSVSSAGDVNADGYDDFIIGGYSADFNGSASGSSYVVYGKANGTNGTLSLTDIVASNGSLGFRLDGENSDDYSGYSVSSAGDVNGDGYDDLIIGAFGADFNAKSGSGSTYIVYGKATDTTGIIDLVDVVTSNGSLGFRLDGETLSDRSAISVSSAGDVNGDGYDDLIIGADGAYTSGSSYVVYGKANGNNGAISLIDIVASNGSLGFRLDGQIADSNSGLSVSSAGDVNADGYDDLIIGADGTHFNGNYSGSSYIVYGKATNASGVINLADIATGGGNLGFRLDGQFEQDRSGQSVSSAGDVNGDGYDDLIIGVHRTDFNGNSSGSSYIVYGKATGILGVIDLADIVAGNGGLGFRLDGQLALDFNGYSVSSAGDINGDGYDDLIIGANSASFNGNNSGSSYVVFGKANGTTGVINLADIVASNGNLGFRLDGELAHDFNGYSVSSAGDINADGYDDLIIGSGFTDFNGNNSGSGYVIFGSALFSSSAQAATLGDDILTGSVTADTLNGGAGDDVINANAGDDILIGGVGSDTLTGGAGADRMWGGGNADKFVFTAGDSLINIAAGVVTGYDIIYDFAVNNANFVSETFEITGAQNIVVNVTDFDGTDSVLTIGGNVIITHSVSAGIVSFKTSAGAVEVNVNADIAAALQYLQLQDLGIGGSTLAFDVGSDSFMFVQGNDAGDDSQDIVVRLESVQIDSLITANNIGAFDLFIA